MDHTIALIRRAHEGDENARAQLVEENTGLIWCVVKRFYGRGTEAEDLFQIGSIGLLKAIDKFDLGYDVKFSTYAVPMITGEIKRFLRDDGMLKVSRSLKEIAYKAYQAKEALTEKLGREPLLEEIAEETGVEKEELVMAMEAAGEVESLHRPVGMKDSNAAGKDCRYRRCRRKDPGSSSAYRADKRIKKRREKASVSALFCR